jgi:Tol biopolymer transport system component
MRQGAVVRILLLCAGTILGVRHAPAVGSETLTERWAEAMRAKQWVTAFTDGSRKDVVPLRVNLLVVSVGGRESIVFRAGPEDIEIGGPVVSPDGTRLAFVKTSEEHGRHRTAIYGMATDGSALRSLVELAPALGPIKGAETGPAPLAWSHDNKRIVFFGTLKEEAPTRPTRRPGDPFEPESLLLLEVDSGRLVTLIPAIGRRVFGSGIGGPVITSQAWAPDDRRLVYMDDRGHVIILDSATRSEQDLGAGMRPTWSPDGRFVAFQIPGGRKSRRDGDYMLVPVDAPNERAVLLSNARRLTLLWGMGYSGAPIWSPDSRYVNILYVPGEQPYPYLFDRITGEGTKLPFRSLGDSWGGKP